MLSSVAAMSTAQLDELSTYATHLCCDARSVRAVRQALYRRTLGLVQARAQHARTSLWSLLNHRNVARLLMRYVTIEPLQRLELVQRGDASSEYVRRQVNTHSEYIGASVAALLLQRRAWQTQPCDADVVHVAKFTYRGADHRDPSPKASSKGSASPASPTKRLTIDGWRPASATVRAPPLPKSDAAAAPALAMVRLTIATLQPKSIRHNAPLTFLNEARVDVVPKQDGGDAGDADSDLDDGSLCVLPWGVHGVYRGNVDLSRAHVAPGGEHQPSRYIPHKVDLTAQQRCLLLRDGCVLRVSVRHRSLTDGPSGRGHIVARSAGIAVLFVEGRNAKAAEIR